LFEPADFADDGWGRHVLILSRSSAGSRQD
jgi:hypothetical protein